MDKHTYMYVYRENIHIDLYYISHFVMQCSKYNKQKKTVNKRLMIPNALLALQVILKIHYLFLRWQRKPGSMIYKTYILCKNSRLLGGTFLPQMFYTQPNTNLNIK